MHARDDWTAARRAGRVVDPAAIMGVKPSVRSNVPQSLAVAFLAIFGARPKGRIGGFAGRRRETRCRTRSRFASRGWSVARARHNLVAIHDATATCAAHSGRRRSIRLGVAGSRGECAGRRNTGNTSTFAATIPIASSRAKIKGVAGHSFAARGTKVLRSTSRACASGGRSRRPPCDNIASAQLRRRDALFEPKAWPHPKCRTKSQHVTA